MKFSAAPAKLVPVKLVPAKILSLLLSLAAALLVVTGCAPEKVEEPFAPSESHSSYAEGLKKMNLAETEMGARWLRQAEEALDRPVRVELPFRERGFFDPARPEAWGYRFTVEQGRKVVIQLSLPDGDELKVFADVFRAEEGGDDEERQIHHVASYSKDENEIRFEVIREQSYILRLQPELLRGGNFTVSIRHEPLLAFPVEGANMADIQSFYGDARDGGSRDHEGVDIFAPRGTPILAVTEARVRSADTRDLGGKTVLLWDEERQLHYYYAHLDSWKTEDGARVEPGDVLGTVGNTGNAKTTPPHLHFGVYKRWFDALNPWPFLQPSPGKPGEPALAAGELNRWMRTSRAVAPSGAPGTSSASSASTASAASGEEVELPPGSPVLAAGSAGDQVRVILPGGEGYGFLPARALRPIAASNTQSLSGTPRYLYPQPDSRAPAFARIDTGSEVAVLGAWKGYRLIRLEDGRTGWISSS